MPEDQTSHDIIIIGAGPAGCTAALYAARAGLRTVMVSPTALSGMAAHAPLVANWPGLTEPIRGEDLVGRFRAQALAAGAEHEIASVGGAELSGEIKQIFAGRKLLSAPAVIIATGAMAPSSKLPGEDELQGRGVCYCTACDGPFYRGEDVLVVGDDAQAVEEALNLSTIASTVSLVTSRPQIAAEGNLQEALQAADNVTVECGLKILEVLGDDGVTGARFRSPDGERVMEAGGIFLYLRGAAPATEFLMGLLDTDERGFILTDELGRASRPGVYAAGDVRSKQVRQMVVAAGEGATAALAAESQLRHKGVRLDRGDAR